MSGDAVSSSVALGVMPLEWELVGAADYDVDGQTDILWQNTATNECSVWLMHGTTVDSLISLASPAQLAKTDLVAARSPPVFRYAGLRPRQFPASADAPVN